MAAMWADMIALVSDPAAIAAGIIGFLGVVAAIIAVMTFARW